MGDYPVYNSLTNKLKSSGQHHIHVMETTVIQVIVFSD